MEIERKFIVKCIPAISLEKFNPTLIKQGYLYKDPIEIRIRQKGDKYYLTSKSNGNLERKEVEFGISKENFDDLKNQFNINLLEKIRYEIPLTSKLIIELDVYHNDLKGLMIAEVEFDSLEEANKFNFSYHQTF